MEAASREQRPLKILLAGPRGFCAGVDRAIQIVERLLEQVDEPVFVRHEIVHNRHVVENLEKKGAVFVDELASVPKENPVVFSAHGVARSVMEEARERDMRHVDATCPLVTKVHVEAARLRREGKSVILIGHAGHPEVIGTLGQFAEGEMLLVENTDQARSVSVPDPNQVAYVTQTTLSVDDTADIITVLRSRFPALAEPRKETICYATTNRQAAVKAMARECDALIVLGAPNSSNSNRLAEVARISGVPKSFLVQNAGELDPSWLDNVSTLGITAGASAPEILVQGLISSLARRFEVTVEERSVVREDVTFSLPRILAD